MAADPIPLSPEAIDYPRLGSPEQSRAAERALFGAEGLSFASLIDIVNPLHHFPVVSTLYRAISGDRIAPAPRILGGALFGGPVGLLSAAVNALIEGVTGRDIGGHALAAFYDPSPAAATVAQALPWVDPDTAGPIHSAASTVAKPWVDPDLPSALAGAASKPAAVAWAERAAQAYLRTNATLPSAGRRLDLIR